MLGKPETTFFGHLPLPVLDGPIKEFLDATAIEAHQMIMVRTFIELEYRLARLEMTARQNPRLLELGQYPVNRCQPDVHVLGKQRAVDILGGQVATAGAMENIQHLQPRGGHLEAGRLEITHSGHATYDSGMPPMHHSQRP